MKSITFKYTDPRTLDGTPFEVAKVAAEQAVRMLDRAVEALDDVFVMARVAEMERELQQTDEAKGSEFREQPLGRTLSLMVDDQDELKKQLETLIIGIAYDPRNPPEEDE